MAYCQGRVGDPGDELPLAHRRGGGAVRQGSGAVTERAGLRRVSKHASDGLEALAVSGVTVDAARAEVLVYPVGRR